MSSDGLPDWETAPRHDLPLTNRHLAELLYRAADRQDAEHRRRAYLRAARAAFTWDEEAAELPPAGRSLTELRAIGPYLARVVHEWLAAPPEVAPPPPPRSGFLTRAQVERVLAAGPAWTSRLQGDLQAHTTWSDGQAELEPMARRAHALGHAWFAVTDHSKGLPIAHGMDETRLAAQADEVARVNALLASEGVPLRVLHGIEMNLDVRGAGDMDPSALAALDVVLGAFHSALRGSDDRTARYMGAMRNPTVHVLAHPRTRRYGDRAGLDADWPRVFEAAREAGKAIEIDGHPERQDLDVPRLLAAREADVWISIGSDAHHPDDLVYVRFALAAAVLAGIRPERVLNLLPAVALLERLHDGAPLVPGEP
jgi:histidinol phosphatase-like PHP family hydrolase